MSPVVARSGILGVVFVSYYIVSSIDVLNFISVARC